MTCVICKQGRVQAGRTNVTFQRGGSTVIFKDVPTDVCDNCGEYYLSEPLADRLHGLAEESIRNGVEVEVLKYAA